MNEQTVVYLQNKILFISAKQQTIDTCYKMDKSQKHYAKRKKLDARDHVLNISIYTKCPEKGKSIETESKYISGCLGRKGCWE